MRAESDISAIMHFDAVNRYSSRDKQRGVALIMTMLAIVLIIATVLVNYFNPETKRLRMEQRTQESLARAKEALIAYAATNYERNPGVFAALPCPDSNPLINLEGQQDPNCGNSYASAVGLFPWNAFGLEALRDGYGECLWYAVSGHYKTQTVTPMTNEDSPGQLLLYAADGNTLITPDTPDTRLVAAIFGPGLPSQGQNRGFNPGTQCGGDYNANNFLEAVGQTNNTVSNDVSYGVDRIAQGDKISENAPNLANRINDRIITVSKTELWDAIRNRNYSNLDPGNPGSFQYPADIFQQLTIQLANCIANYPSPAAQAAGDLRLPWAAPVNLNVPWPNNWFYSNENNYMDRNNTFGGRLPFSIPISTGQLPGPGVDIFTVGNCGATPELVNLWTHWKDHIFYIIAEARAPNSANPSQPCGAAPNRCLTVNNVGTYAAILIFAGPVLPGQSRDGPQEPVDQKALTANYLDAGNAAILDGENPPNPGATLGSGNYQYQPGNDIMVCICENLDCDPLTPIIDIDTDCNPATAL